MKPILFNTENVIAILEDRKGATRRVVKPQPTHHIAGCSCGGYFDTGKNQWACEHCGGEIEPLTGRSRMRAPYQPGDILYVRETWSFLFGAECGCFCTGPCENEFNGEHGCYVYRTDYGTTEDDTFPPSMFRWHPSIHMPKEAARIFLRVTDVRVERLQEMTQDDAEREGCREWQNPETKFTSSPLLIFSELWDRTIKKPDIALYGWDANPWVWVIEFERCEKQEGE